LRLGRARDGKIRIVARGADLANIRDQTIRLIVAHAAFVQERGDVAARFVQAYRDTIAWMYADPAAVKAYAAFAGVPEAIATMVRDEFYPRDGLDPDRISGLDAVMADAVSFKYLPAPLTGEQIAQLIVIPPP